VVEGPTSGKSQVKEDECLASYISELDAFYSRELEDVGEFRRIDEYGQSEQLGSDRLAVFDSANLDGIVPVKIFSP
jgi:hypothetical protein